MALCSGTNPDGSFCMRPVLVDGMKCAVCLTRENREVLEDVKRAAYDAKVREMGGNDR